MIDISRKVRSRERFYVLVVYLYTLCIHFVYIFSCSFVYICIPLFVYIKKLKEAENEPETLRVVCARDDRSNCTDICRSGFL